jgi:hypothetical protein
MSAQKAGARTLKDGSPMYPTLYKVKIL